jgi:hypothetical protein
MSLDHVAARMVMRARQLERALHDPGPWSITVGPDNDQWEIPARKVVGEDHVTFIAVVPLEGERPVFAELLSGDEIVAVKILEPVGGYAQVSWSFVVNEASVNA